MRIAEMNWMQVEQLVARDRRAVLPMGSTEQHAQLSLCVDAILAERVVGRGRRSRSRCRCFRQSTTASRPASSTTPAR